MGSMAGLNGWTESRPQSGFDLWTYQLVASRVRKGTQFEFKKKSINFLSYILNTYFT